MSRLSIRDEMQDLAGRNYRHWTDFIERTDADVPPPRGLMQPRDKCAVIVEPRTHRHLSYVIRNVMHFLDASWGLCIVHGTGNREFVEQIVEGWGEVLLLNCGKADLPDYAYADYRCRAAFWEQIPSESILTFETDSILRRSGIDDFLEYDYVGAPWLSALLDYRNVPGPVGNGGLSFRHKSAMLRILREHEHEPGTSEDQFFSRWLYRDDYNVPSFETASHFSTETILQPDCLGIHKPWLYHFETPFVQLLDGIHY